MPSRPLVPCSAPGCRELVEGKGKCSRHKVSRKSGSHDVRVTGRRWMRLREMVLRRDGGLCVPCKNAGRVTVATQVDHIVPLAKGSIPDDLAGCQAICDRCHAVKSAQERGATPKREVGLDGVPEGWK